ncbi:MAG: hypothetical protein HZB32_05175 [Nitrospirae bacterium]|nr:hypothetical protein [Nitrospirota bacterium]
MWIRSTVLILFLFIGGWAFIPPASAGQAVLSWDPPTTNVDGSPLTDLNGYRIYYGIFPGVYETVTDVGNVITSTVTNLTDGSLYYFAVTTYDLSGNESDFSNEVNKSILSIPPGNIDTSTPASVNRVDGYDLLSLELAWGSTPLSTYWNPMADLDGDGIINQSDLDILIQNFGAIK